MKTTIKILLIAVCTLVFCAGCVSLKNNEKPITAVSADGTILNRIPGTTSIIIPPQMTNKAALDAFENALIATNPGNKNQYWTSNWRLEARDSENKWIRVGLSVRQHYLCVCYRIENGKLIPDVPESINLNQNGNEIHRKVPLWINRLNPLIRAKLYEADRENH